MLSSVKRILHCARDRSNPPGILCVLSDFCWYINFRSCDQYICQTQSPRSCPILSLGIILTFVFKSDASIWHIAPLIVMAVLTETVRIATKYNWIWNVIGTIIMTFSSFDLFSQMWFNRDCTYECVCT